MEKNGHKNVTIHGKKRDNTWKKRAFLWKENDNIFSKNDHILQKIHFFEGIFQFHFWKKVERAEAFRCWIRFCMTQYKWYNVQTLPRFRLFPEMELT